MIRIFLLLFFSVLSLQSWGQMAALPDGGYLYDQPHVTEVEQNYSYDSSFNFTKITESRSPFLQLSERKIALAFSDGFVAAKGANFTRKQLDKKFKHASDFGINSTKKNSETLAQFESAIKDHLGDSATVQKGTYGFSKDSTVYFNPNTNNVVVLDKSGNFLTGFKLDPTTPQYQKYISEGFLR